MDDAHFAWLLFLYFCSRFAIVMCHSTMILLIQKQKSSIKTGGTFTLANGAT